MPRRDSTLRRALVAFAGAVFARLLRLLGATWRVRVASNDPVAAGRMVIGASWHRSLFVMAHHSRDRGAVVMVSRSRDGDLIDAVLCRLGYAPSPRGSSSRGGASALRGQLSAARGGRYTGILCDGPRGPARRIHEGGVLFLSRKADLPIQTIAFAARPAIRFASWDRVILPLPFARVRVAYGRRFDPPARGEEAAAARERKLELDHPTDRLDQSLGLRPEMFPALDDAAPAQPGKAPRRAAIR